MQWKFSIRLITNWHHSQIYSLSLAVVQVPTFLLFDASSYLWSRVAAEPAFGTCLIDVLSVCFLTQQQDWEDAKEIPIVKMPKLLYGPLHRLLSTSPLPGKENMVKAVPIVTVITDAGGPCWLVTDKTWKGLGKLDFG